MSAQVGIVLAQLHKGETLKAFEKAVAIYANDQVLPERATQLLAQNLARQVTFICRSPRMSSSVCAHALISNGLLRMPTKMLALCVASLFVGPYFPRVVNA